MATRKQTKASPARGRNSTLLTNLLRKKILRFELKPGEMIDEVSVATQMGVSRTPIREALIRLAGENLVELIPNRGARVTSIDLLDTHEVFELLEVVQGVATRWAALRRSVEDIEAIRAEARAFLGHVAAGRMLEAVQSNFDCHMKIAQASGNSLLSATYSNLLSRTFRLGLLTLHGIANHDAERRLFEAEIQSEHDALVDAIVHRDAEAAERIARTHARGFLQRVSRVITDNLARETGTYNPHKPWPRRGSLRAAQ
jgi:DNA-binding GntR family transcriptional regulator